MGRYGGSRQECRGGGRWGPRGCVHSAYITAAARGNNAPRLRGFIIIWCHLGPHNLPLHRPRTTIGRRGGRRMNGCEERRRGEFISTQGNSSHSVCASARYRHRAREFAFFAPRSLSMLFIGGAKKTHSSLRFIHGTGASARQSVFGRRVSLHHSHSLSSPSPIQRSPPIPDTMQHPPIQSTVAFLTLTLLCWTSPRRHIG